MSEFKDEVLNGSPKFKIKDDNGNVVYSQATIEMITEIITEGTELNKALFDRIMPSGLIAMWSGAVNNIPAGWYLCNGQNGTPDLRNRFVVGAGSTYSVGNTGGSSTVTLTENQMPAHTHSCSSETVSKSFAKGNTSINAQGTNPVFAQGTFSYSQTLNMGSHSHTIGSKGGGASHENKPPYYALAYIMKA